jgi:hypothetical protein
MQRVFGHFYELRKAQHDAPAPNLVGQNQLLYECDLTAASHAQVWSLSPSPDDVLAAMAEFSQLFVPLPEFASGIAAIYPNDSAVVVLVTVGPDAILLGSDLGNRPSQHAGWNAVVGSWMAAVDKSGFFKVAHHGSENSISDALWEQKIASDAVAVVTPYSPSGLPNDEGIARLKAFGRKLYATAIPRRVTVNRGAAVASEIRMSVRNLESVELPDFGMVRLRKSIGVAGNWNVETFGAAVEL